MDKIDQIKITRGGKLLRIWNVPMPKPTIRSRIRSLWNRLLVRLNLQKEVERTFYVDDPIIVHKNGPPLTIEVFSDDEKTKSITLIGKVVESGKLFGPGDNVKIMVTGANVDEITKSDR